MFHVTGTGCHFLLILSLETSGRAQPTRCWMSWPWPSRALSRAHVFIHTNSPLYFSRTCF